MTTERPTSALTGVWDYRSLRAGAGIAVCGRPSRRILPLAVFGGVRSHHLFDGRRDSSRQKPGGVIICSD